MRRFLACLTLSALCVGCSPPAAKKGGPSAATAPPVDGKAFVLAAEPAGAKGVIDVRKAAQDGDEVVVAGKVGGSTKPLTEGRAAFLLVDPSLKPSEECDCPWDFCEVPKKELAAARLSVKVVDADGKTVAAGARELFGMKELSGVVVKGKVSRDKEDNVVIVATGVYVQPEKN